MVDRAMKEMMENLPQDKERIEAMARGPFLSIARTKELVQMLHSIRHGIGPHFESVYQTDTEISAKALDGTILIWDRCSGAMFTLEPNNRMTCNPVEVPEMPDAKSAILNVQPMMLNRPATIGDLASCPHGTFHITTMTTGCPECVHSSIGRPPVGVSETTPLGEHMPLTKEMQTAVRMLTLEMSKASEANNFELPDDIVTILNDILAPYDYRLFRKKPAEAEEAHRKAAEKVKARFDRTVADGVKEHLVDGYWLFVAAGPVRWRQDALVDWNALPEEDQEALASSAEELKEMWRLTSL